MSLQRVKSGVWNTGDNLVVETMAGLPNADREGIIFVAGRLRPNDGEGGWFRYNVSANRKHHDGDSIIDPSGTGVGKGCWIRQHYYTAPAGLTRSEVQTSQANQSIFKLKTFTYRPGEGELSVYVNGTRLTQQYSYAETDSITVTMDGSLRDGDVVEFLKYEQPTGAQGQALEAAQVHFDDTRTTQVKGNDVQVALEALDNLVGHATGGGPINAGTITILPKAPNTSTNIQDFAYWLQDYIRAHVDGTPGPGGAVVVNTHPATAITYDDRVSSFGNTLQAALDNIYTRLGHGLAKDIGFENSDTQTPKLDPVTNLQDLGKKTYDLLEAHYAELVAHKNQVNNAHDAAAIKFDAGANPPAWIGKSQNVQDALNHIVNNFQSHVIAASQITLDDPNNLGLGNTVQDELEASFKRVHAHVTATQAHDASSINYQPSALRLINQTGLGNVDNVQEALNTLELGIEQHQDSKDAHDAKSIRIVQSGLLGNSANVEQALNYINQGNWRYRGHLHLDQFQVQVSTFSNAINDFWTVPVPATGLDVDPSWMAMFHPSGQPPSRLNHNGYAFSDGQNLWFMYIVNTLQDGIVTRPPAGTNQGIETADAADTALTLTGVAGQTADLLVVQGSVSFDDLTVQNNVQVNGLVQDATGSLRQTADEVLLQPRATLVSATPNSVQQFLFQNKEALAGHIAGTQGQLHAATSISFSPIAGIQGNNVQLALENVYHQLDTHSDSTLGGVKHVGSQIEFDAGTTGLTAKTVTAAVIEVQSNLDDHENTGRHNALNIDVNGGGAVPAGDLEAALAAVAALASNHIAAPNAHDAANVDFAGFAGIGAPATFDNVEAALLELESYFDGHINGAAGAGQHPATAINVAAAGNIAAGTLQSVLQALDGRIDVVAGQATGTDVNGGTF